MTETPPYRQTIAEYIRAQAKPTDKFSHQPRLYALARSLADGQAYDDDVVYAAAWMHDLGVFIGHRPEELEMLAAWDHIAYAIKVVPGRLDEFGFPAAKIPAVIEAIRTHLPSRRPETFEGVLLRDADILEQLGAIGMLRVISKVGRDTRFPTHAEAVQVIRRSIIELPSQLVLPLARRLAEQRVVLMEAFLRGIEEETPSGPR